MFGRSSRIFREKRCIEVMTQIYCREHHQHMQHVQVNRGKCDNGFCVGCMQLLEYSQKRLDHCPYQEGKTTCFKCPTHCYKPAMREQIRKVMRFSGPRMPLRHPFFSITHIVDGFRKTPINLKKKRSAKRGVTTIKTPKRNGSVKSK